MNKCLILSFAALAAIAGCSSETTAAGGTGGAGGIGGSGGAGGAGGAARACATDIDVGEVQMFGAVTPNRTEGMTFDADGNLFVSSQAPDVDDELLAVTLEGATEAVAAAESILGLASHADGIIAAGFDTGELLLIDPETGMSEPIAAGLGEPNFVVTTPWDTILVSADSPAGSDTIFEVTWDGDVSTWVDGVPTPNGMVFSLDNQTLYVATTFEEKGLWQVPVLEDGQAGMPEKWVSWDEVGFPDGVAIDSLGNVYIAVNIPANQIAQVAPDGTLTIVGEGVVGAASLAFGQGEFDPCSVYVTNLVGTQMWRVGIGIPGTEN